MDSRAVLGSVILAICLQGICGQEFVTDPQKKAVLLGEDIQFECGVSREPGAQETPIFWNFLPVGAEHPLLLAMDGNIFKWNTILEIDTQSRDGFQYRNLKLSDVTLAQEGDYICTVPGEEDRLLVNSLTINIPPSIALSPDVEKIQVEKGNDLMLSCIAEGKPAPLVEWTRVAPENVLPDGSEVFEGSDLILHDSDKYTTGIYECTARNDAGTEIKAVSVEVMFAPEVTVEEEWIHTGPGDNVEVSCSFSASPTVTIKWFHNATEINKDSGRDNLKFGVTNSDYEDVHFLRIESMRPEDLGTYECMGMNDRGTATGTTVLAAYPHSLKVKSKSSGKYSDQYTLRFDVVSLPQLTEFEIVLKERNNTEEFVIYNESIPGPPASGKKTLNVKHVIRDLSANTSYSGKIRAKNAFGSTNWTDFQIVTADEGNTAPLPTTPPPRNPSTAERDVDDNSVTKTEAEKTTHASRDSSAPSQAAVSFFLLVTASVINAL